MTAKESIVLILYRVVFVVLLYFMWPLVMTDIFNICRISFLQTIYLAIFLFILKNLMKDMDVTA